MARLSIRIDRAFRPTEGQATLLEVRSLMTSLVAVAPQSPAAIGPIAPISSSAIRPVPQDASVGNPADLTPQPAPVAVDDGVSQDGDGMPEVLFGAAFNGGDLKKVPDKDLKNVDVHKFKEDEVGADSVSKFDIYKDKDGKIVLVKKSDTSVKVETSETIDTLPVNYPKKKTESTTS